VSFGSDTAGLLKDLERAQRIIQVEADRYYSTEAVNEMIAALQAGMAPGREYSPADLRDLLGSSRKYIVPFLEYCDRIGVTMRRANGRALSSVR